MENLAGKTTDVFPLKLKKNECLAHLNLTEKLFSKMRKECSDPRCNSDSESINQNAFYSLIFVTNNNSNRTVGIAILQEAKSNAKSIL